MRLLGIINLIFFLTKLISDIKRGKGGDSLWICHASNLVLSLGLMLGNSTLIRLAVLCIIPGSLFWIREMIRTKEVLTTSILSHLSGIAIGVYAISKIGISNYAWVHSLAWYLLLQQLCRFYTPFELNVNLAHKIYEGWEMFFKDYKVYWLSSTLLGTFLFWCTGKVLQWIFPVVHSQI